MFKDLLGSFDSPGGHILVCLILIGVGIGAQAFQIDLSKDALVVFSTGVLARSMLGQNGRGPAPPAA
jgi:hypothetical protein